MAVCIEHFIYRLNLSPVMIHGRTYRVQIFSVVAAFTLATYLNNISPWCCFSTPCRYVPANAFLKFMKSRALSACWKSVEACDLWNKLRILQCRSFFTLLFFSGYTWGLGSWILCICACEYSQVTALEYCFDKAGLFEAFQDYVKQQLNSWAYMFSLVLARYIQVTLTCCINSLIHLGRHWYAMKLLFS